MSNTKVLNLDELTSGDEKAVVFKGQRHLAAEVTVEGYLARVKRARDVSDSDTIEQRVAQAIQFLSDTYPTFLAAELNTMAMAKLNALITFTIAPPADIAEQVAAATTETAAGNA